MRCRPERSLRSYVRAVAGGLKLAPHDSHKRVWVMLNLEIPQSDYAPAGVGERPVLALIARDVALDLLVPVAAPTAGLPLAWMAVPEGAVDEDRELPTRERDVDATARSRPVAPEAPKAGVPERGAEHAFGARVLAADARHDAPTTLRRGSGGAQRV